MNKKSQLQHIFIGLMFVCLTAGAALAQSALDGFHTNADGAINVVVVQPDGKILIGGEFSTISVNGGAPVLRVGIARLNRDGTLDMAFDPHANSTVRTIALQADGKILARIIHESSFHSSPRMRAEAPLPSILRNPC